MKKHSILTYFGILTFLLLVTSCNQKAFDKTYYFVTYDQLHAFKQKNDTMYRLVCENNFNCFERPKKQAKIIESKKQGNITFLVLENIPSHVHSKKPLKEKRFHIMAIEKLSRNTIKVFSEAITYTKDSVLKIPLETSLIENKFGITLYEENYLKSLPTDYMLNDELQKELIQYTKDFESIDSEIIERYKNTKTNDVYAVMLIQELISTKMVSQNLSPISALKKLADTMEKDNTMNSNE